MTDREALREPTACAVCGDACWKLPGFAAALCGACCWAPPGDCTASCIECQERATEPVVGEQP